MNTAEKTQWIRLFDVFVIGPAIIYYGGDVRSDLGRTLLYAIGAGTILYNGANYLTNQAQQQRVVLS